MSRLILAIAILIPLATIFFVTLTSDRGNDTQPDRQVEEQNVEDDAEVEKHFTVEITNDNYESMVKKSEQPVILDFWAPWCGPCMMLGPHLDKVAEDYDGLAVVGKLNIDEHQELAKLHEVESIPLVLILKDGEVVGEFVGFDQNTPGKIREAIDGLIDP